MSISVLAIVPSNQTITPTHSTILLDAFNYLVRLFNLWRPPCLSRRSFAATCAANATSRPAQLTDEKTLYHCSYYSLPGMAFPHCSGRINVIVRASDIDTTHALKRRLLHHQREPPSFKYQFTNCRASAALVRRSVYESASPTH